MRHHGDELVEIGVAGGRVVAMERKIDASARIEIDAGGNLATEGFVNPHLHLCKAYTRDMLDEEALRNYHEADMGKAMTAIELATRVKEKYAELWIVKNARRAVALAALHGTTHLRAFADVDSKARLEGVKALIKAREEFRAEIDIEVVAFAQSGIVREVGAAELLRQAMKLGADVVGGIPWIEYTNADMKEHVKLLFKVAQEFDKDVSMLVDDAGDPGLRSLEVMAVEALRCGWQGRSLAHHARAMALYPQPYLQKVVALLRRAEIGIVCDPHTGPLHAPVRELLRDGVLVCLGQDDISDAFYPYGRNNMLEVAFLASHLLWMTTAADMETLYDMITVKAARAIGLKDHALRVGSPANLVVLQELNVLEALRNHSIPLWVISNGRLVDQTQMKFIAGGCGENSSTHGTGDFSSC